MGHRWYDPTIGRFLSQDTFPADLTDPQSWNRYVYVKNNPLIYTNPLGLSPWDSICDIGMRGVKWGGRGILKKILLIPSFFDADYTQTIPGQKRICINEYECFENPEQWPEGSYVP